VVANYWKITVVNLVGICITLHVLIFFQPYNSNIYIIITKIITNDWLVCFYAPVFKRGRIMVYQCPTVRPFHKSHSNLRTPWPIHFKFHKSYWNWWSYGLYTLWWNFEFSFQSYWTFIHQIVRDFKAIFSMSRCKLRTPLPIHFKLRIVIGIDSLMICILFGEISTFHSRVMGLYSSNCRRFFVCRAVNWEPLGQFTSNFA
jgi:hypothetical protein